MNNKSELSADEIERGEKVLSITKEIVQELDIKSQSEYTKRADNDEWWIPRLYKSENDRDVLLMAEVGTGIADVKIQFSLGAVTYRILLQVEELLNKETTSQVLKPSVFNELKKRNISILKLFDIKEEDLQETIIYNTKNILRLFISNVGNFAKYTFVDAVGHAVIGHLENVVKEAHKDYWAELGLPNDFKLITDSDLDKKENIMWIEKDTIWVIESNFLLRNPLNHYQVIMTN